MSNINQNESSSNSQNEQIKKFLENGGKITPIDALNYFGCFRLSARAWDLRNKYGMNLHVKNVIRNGKRVAEYSL